MNDVYHESSLIVWEALILLTYMALLLKHPIEAASLQPALWRRMSDQRFFARAVVFRELFQAE